MNSTDLQTELKNAMLARDELKTGVLRMLKAEILKIQTDGSGTEITPEIITNVIQKLVKQRKDSAEQFRTGSRPELAEQEESEIAILQAYLPEQMSEDAIREVVRNQKTALNITDKSGMGKLMGALMNELKGKADGSTIKKIVEEEL